MTSRERQIIYLSDPANRKSYNAYQRRYRRIQKEADPQAVKKKQKQYNKAYIQRKKAKLAFMAAEIERMQQQ